nr:hypothetical protein [uncultured Rhodopila sp.]
MRKAIEKARVRPEKPRLKEKTIERHFSAMKQFREHIGKRSADQSIFDGIQHKVIESRRWPWAEDALDKLLRARWNPSCRPANRISEETHAWLVAIGGYIGARVEEIARLRVSDIEDIGGVPCFIIRAQAHRGVGRAGALGGSMDDENGVRRAGGSGASAAYRRRPA